jgi:peptide/nickel transport system substrate-binding protein
VCTPLHFGYESDVTAYPYDPEKARELLKAAGYPDGFGVDFYAGISEGTAEQVVRDLKAVGIKANLKWMGGHWRRFYKKFLNGEMPLALLTWGSYSIFDASAIMNPFFMKSAPGCYGTTPEVDRLLRAADATLDQEGRKAFFSEAQKIIAREAFWVPLVKNRSIAVMNRALNFQPSYDEIDRYFTVSWQNP